MIIPLTILGGLWLAGGVAAHVFFRSSRWEQTGPAWMMVAIAYLGGPVALAAFVASQAMWEHGE